MMGAVLFFINADVFGQACAFCTGNRVSVGANFVPESVMQVDTAVTIGRMGNNDGNLYFHSQAGNSFWIETPVNLTDQKYVLPITQGANNSVLTTDAGGQLSWSAPGTINNAWLTTGNGSTTAGTNFLGTTDAIDLVIKTAGTERMRVMAAGNVGIGTNVPSALLHMSATASCELRMERAAGNSSRIKFAEGGTEIGNFLIDNNGHYKITNLTAAGNLRLQVVKTGGGSPYDAIFIEGDQAFVGVGTSNPDTKFHVKAPASSSITGEKVAYFENMNVGIGNTSPGYKLDVQGTGSSNIHINTNGKMQATEFVVFSDQMFKNQVETIENALSLIDQFTPRNYFYDTLNFNGEGKFSFGSEKQYGFIAQEVEQILPELVHRSIKPAFIDSLGNVLIDSYEFRALNYTALIPILTKGIQELRFEDAGIQQELVNLQNQVDQLTLINNELQEQMQELMLAVNACCGQTDPSFRLGDFEDDDSEVKQTQVTLSDKKFVVLEQNIPNPFAERTTINYIVPSNATDSRILFHDAAGRQIQSIAIETGKGSIDVFASDLSSGIYTYTLLVDDKVIETKKMTKSN